MKRTRGQILNTNRIVPPVLRGGVSFLRRAPDAPSLTPVSIREQVGFAQRAPEDVEHFRADLRVWAPGDPTDEMRHARIEIAAVAGPQNLGHLLFFGVGRHFELTLEHVHELLTVMLVPRERFPVDVPHTIQVRVHVTRRKSGRERIAHVGRGRVFAVGGHAALPRGQPRHLARPLNEIVGSWIPGVAEKLPERFAERAREPNHDVERQAARAGLDLFELAILEPHHARDLLGGPAAALAQRAELTTDHLGAAIFAVAFGEESCETPVLAGRERGRARGDHLNAFGRLAAARANAMRQARSEMDTVAAPELFMLHAARRLDRELDRTLKHEGELVLVVITEAIGARREPCEQRLEVW